MDNLLEHAKETKGIKVLYINIHIGLLIPCNPLVSLIMSSNKVHYISGEKSV